MCSVLSTLSVREGRRKDSRVHVYWQAEHQAEGTRQTSLSLSVQQEGASGETIEGKLRKKWKISRPWWALLWSWVKDMHSPGSLVARAGEPHGFEEEGWSAPLLCLVYPHSTHQHGIRTSRCQVWATQNVLKSCRLVGTSQQTTTKQQPFTYVLRGSIRTGSGVV